MSKELLSEDGPNDNKRISEQNFDGIIKRRRTLDGSNSDIMDETIGIPKATTSEGGGGGDHTPPGPSSESENITYREGNRLNCTNPPTTPNIQSDTGESTRNIEVITREQEQCHKAWAQRCYDLFRSSTGFYISDVLPARSYNECIRICQALQDFGRVSYKRGLLLLSIHNKHVHVVHECSFSNKTCRCSFIQKAEIQFGLRRRGRTFRRRHLCNQLEISDLENIFAYYETKERETNYLRIGGTVERMSLKHKGLQVGQPERCTETGILETCESLDDAELRREEFECNESLRSFGKGNPNTIQQQHIKRKNKGEVMSSLLETHLCCPVKGILSLPVWIYHPKLNMYNDADQIVNKVIDNWEKKLCAFTINDFNTLYNQPDVKVYFSCGHNPFDSYYYNIEDSLDLLIALLEDQFHNDSEIITKFVTDLYNVLEKRIPKLNSLLIYSEPSAGKNLFLDCIKDYFLNVGKLQNANRYNSFSFQDAPNRRIIFWNEPNYEPSKIETLKEILGGDTTNTPVKYRGEGVLYRTPVLLATNKHLSIMSNPAFKDRIAIYKWHSCPMLKKYKKKPNPLCTYELFKHYGIIKQ